jgi:hypothetical protein
MELPLKCGQIFKVEVVRVNIVDLCNICYVFSFYDDYMKFWMLPNFLTRWVLINIL